MNAPPPVPVIAIDGPAAAGKGAVARAVAAALGFHYLDSGKYYRALALAAGQRQINVDDAPALVALAAELENSESALAALFADPRLPAPDISAGASRLSRHAEVRRALLPWQLATRRRPGLVADGRDMGSVVFPDAALKIFLTADLQTRAQRRLLQLQNAGISATMRELVADLRARDRQDAERATAPMIEPEGCRRVDSTRQTVDEVVARITSLYHGVAASSD